jgi:hypothetical protein
LQKSSDIDTFTITRLIWWRNVADFGQRVVVRGLILTGTRLSPLMGFEGEFIEWTSDIIPASSGGVHFTFWSWFWF